MAPPYCNFPPSEENLSPWNDEARQNPTLAIISQRRKHTHWTSWAWKRCQKNKVGSAEFTAEALKKWRSAFRIPTKVHVKPTPPRFLQNFPTKCIQRTLGFNDARILIDASGASGGLSASQMWSAVTLNAARLVQTFVGFLTFSPPAAGGSRWLKRALIKRRRRPLNFGVDSLTADPGCPAHSLAINK